MRVNWDFQKVFLNSDIISLFFSIVFLFSSPDVAADNKKKDWGILVSSYRQEDWSRFFAISQKLRHSLLIANKWNSPQYDRLLALETLALARFCRNDLIERILLPSLSEDLPVFKEALKWLELPVHKDSSKKENTYHYRKRSWSKPISEDFERRVKVRSHCN